MACPDCGHSLAEHGIDGCYRRFCDNVECPCLCECPRPGTSA